MSAGFVSRTFGRWHGLGPWIYFERGGFMLHAWARYFRLEWHRGFKWRVCLRVRHRYVAFWRNG